MKQLFFTILLLSTQNFNDAIAAKSLKNKRKIETNVRFKTVGVLSKKKLDFIRDKLIEKKISQNLVNSILKISAKVLRNDQYLFEYDNVLKSIQDLGLYSKDADIVLKIIKDYSDIVIEDSLVIE